MRWPRLRRTDDELRALAVELTRLLQAACAVEPESEHEAIAEAALLGVYRRERLGPDERRQLAEHLEDYACLNAQRALMQEEPAGHA